VFESLPAHFEQAAPKLVKFLELYYEQTTKGGAGKRLEELQTKRDFVSAGEDLLRFFSNELLLGRDYFDTFIDKQSAIQSSNLLYRSKGTHYSIQQFFRVFFGFDIDVRYGRDEVLLVGDPYDETLEYEGQYLKDGTYFPGDRLRFTFDDGQIIVSALGKDPVARKRDALYIEKYNTIDPYVEDMDDYVEPYDYDIIYEFFYTLRQDIDYFIDYADKSIVLLNGITEPVSEDPWVTHLAANGRIAEGAKVKIEILRDAPAGSPVGGEVSEKRITNNAFYQLFSLAIASPISIKNWREPYKDFVHPAGMYLESSVMVESQKKLFGDKTANDVSFEAYRKVVEETDALVAFANTSISELNLRSYKIRPESGLTLSGYSPGDHTPLYEQEWEDSILAYSGERYNEYVEDSDRPDEVFRTRINDVKNIDATLEELDRQYTRMSDIDTINSRRMNETFSDMSQTINTMDENFWHRDRTGIFEVGLHDLCEDTWVLGDQIDFPPEYAGCPNFIFGIGTLRPEKYIRGQYESLKRMDQIPTYQDGDSDGFGNTMPNVAYDGSGALVFDSDYTPETKSIPGPVSGYALWKLTARGLNDSQQAHLVTGVAQVYENYFRGPFVNQYYIEEIPINDSTQSPFSP
jgi:hypothetical protein